MKLQYRGINYESQSVPRTSANSEIIAKFRGFLYRVKHPLKTYLHSVNILKYRGINYIKANQIVSSSDHNSSSEIDTDSGYSIQKDAQNFINDFNKFNF